MKFPGQRKSKHFFPVSKIKDNTITTKNIKSSTYIAGIDQILIDIEAEVDPEVLKKYNISLSDSIIIEKEQADELYMYLKEKNLIKSELAGGSIGNTLHNYSLLADDKSVLFGAMSKEINIGSHPYIYLRNTSSRVDLNYLSPITGDIGKCFTLISKDGERSFAISKNQMNMLHLNSINKNIIQSSVALVITSYLMRVDESETIDKATLKAIEYAKEANVPVVLTLGTSLLIKDNSDYWKNFIKENVTILAMNNSEAFALTGIDDSLLSIKESLNYCDMVLCTAGEKGLYMGGYTDINKKRKTSREILNESIEKFNEYEFSRPMKKEYCDNPIKVYSHISPYMGGPQKIFNTNGAGDAALAALLHDVAANKYHENNVKNSSKYILGSLSYSSFSQICKYANRVAYIILEQNGSRLTKGLPEKEDSLDLNYHWEK